MNYNVLSVTVTEGGRIKSCCMQCQIESHFADLLSDVVKQHCLAIAYFDVSCTHDFLSLKTHKYSLPLIVACTVTSTASQWRLTF